jgi:hypothetical protein
VILLGWGSGGGTAVALTLGLGPLSLMGLHYTADLAVAVAEELAGGGGGNAALVSLTNFGIQAAEHGILCSGMGVSLFLQNAL